MDQAKASREMTCDEWAFQLFSGTHPLTPIMVAQALRQAEMRGTMRERYACADLAREHSHTITEEMVGALSIGRDMDEQQRIDLASTMRHVAQYVGVLISQRTPPPPKPLDLAR